MGQSNPVYEAQESESTSQSRLTAVLPVSTDVYPDSDFDECSQNTETSLESVLVAHLEMTRFLLVPRPALAPSAHRPRS